MVCLVVGLTLTNSILTTLLWFRLGDDPDRRGNNAVAVERSENPATDASPSGDQANVASTADPGNSGAGEEGLAEQAPGDGDSDDPTDETKDEELDSAAAGLDPERDAEADSGGAGVVVALDNRVGSGVDQTSGESAMPTPAVVEKPRTYRFECPVRLDGLMVSYLLAHLSDPALADPLDRIMVLLACTRWGSGPPRQTAFAQLERVQARDEDLARLSMLWQKAAADRSKSDVSIGDRGSSERRRLLAELAGRWQERWPRLLASVGPKQSRQWVTEASRSLAQRSDTLVLIDLSQSMEPDMARIVAALEQLVPTCTADGRRRWGWVGFRDEVVDTEPLTDDARAFIDSLARWECADGGDVPEGVDRALHEALRFESFDWQERGERVFVVIGDAPPSYENIPGMTTLLQAAHESPEGYRAHCLGFLRETEWNYVPSFREIAAAGGGEALFLREKLPPGASLWRLIAGVGAPPWESRPF